MVHSTQPTKNWKIFTQPMGQPDPWTTLRPEEANNNLGSLPSCDCDFPEWSVTARSAVVAIGCRVSRYLSNLCLWLYHVWFVLAGGRDRGKCCGARRRSGECCLQQRLPTVSRWMLLLSSCNVWFSNCCSFVKICASVLFGTCKGGSHRCRQLTQVPV